MLKSFDRYCGALHLGLKDSALQRSNQRHLRRFNDVADARAREPALVDDAKALSQYFFAVRGLTHECNMYVRIINVKKPPMLLLFLMQQSGPRFGA
jgi:hypothetical protein